MIYERRIIMFYDKFFDFNNDGELDDMERAMQFLEYERLSRNKRRRRRYEENYYYDYEEEYEWDLDDDYYEDEYGDDYGNWDY